MLFILSIFVRNPLPATAGATIIAAVIGFGAQSFLRDVIAGFSIIFEGQYSVGDFIHVKPQEVSGIVEELGLRMTKIRSLSGEVSYIPNGAMQGVINYVSGQQRFTVEVQLSDPEAVPRVLGSLDEVSELYLAPPRLVEREETDGRLRLRILAGVLPRWHGWSRRASWSASRPPPARTPRGRPLSTRSTRKTSAGSGIYCRKRWKRTCPRRQKKLRG